MLRCTRREFLETAGAGVAALALAPLTARAAEAKPDGFTLPPLPYAYDALEPYIDAETMKIHHDKHHAAYVKNLNTACAKHPELFKKSVEELMSSLKDVPMDVRTAVRNNGGGHANHSLFWTVMGPKKGGEPKGELAKAIAAAFGSFDKFKTRMSTAANTQFGSGWGWLATNAGGKLRVVASANQDDPYMMKGLTPILGVDVWEHAYYLKYKNLRPEYVKQWWNVVNWDEVARRYNERTKG